MTPPETKAQKDDESWLDQLQQLEDLAAKYEGGKKSDDDASTDSITSNNSDASQVQQLINRVDLIETRLAEINGQFSTLTKSIMSLLESGKLAAAEEEAEEDDVNDEFLESQKLELLARYGVIKSDDAPLAEDNELSEETETEKVDEVEKENETTQLKELAELENAEILGEVDEATEPTDHPQDEPIVVNELDQTAIANEELAKLKSELEAKLRKAEVELSIQRAKLSQREASLDEKQAQLDRQAASLLESKNFNSEEKEKPGVLRKLKQHLSILSRRNDDSDNSESKG